MYIRCLCLFFILALSGISGICFAIPLTNALNKHNLSSNSLNTIKANSDTRICIFCHTPHGASAQSALWNRKDPTTASFPLYSSGTLNIDDPGIVALSQYDNSDPSAYPNGATRMCLSCHDGVSAIGGILTGLQGFNTKILMNSDTLLSAYATGLNASGDKVVVDLASSHPVSFVYNSLVRDYLNTPAGGGVPGDYKLPSAVPLDSSNRMQCTTCHDPHDDTRTGTYDLPFWRNSGTGNPLIDYDTTCQDCHLGVNDWGGSWGSGPAPIH